MPSQLYYKLVINELVTITIQTTFTKMKNIFLLYCTLFSIYSAQAQGKVELKANVLSLLFDRIELSGEYLLSRRIGVEAGIGYEWFKISVAEPFVTPTVVREVRESRLINYYLSGKYYFFPKYGGDRLFTGVLLHHQYYASRTVNGQDVEKPKSATAVGIEPGYKWAIKQRFLIEASTRWNWSFPKNGFGELTYDLDLLINGKIGYRF